MHASGGEKLYLRMVTETSKAATYRIVEGKVFKVEGRLYLALKPEHGAIRFINVKDKSVVPIPPFKKINLKLKITKSVELDIVSERVEELKI